MFRCDLFARTAPRDWTPQERAAAADDLHFRVADAGASLPHTVTYGAITAGIAGPPHDVLLAVMGQRGWTLAALLGHPALADVAPGELVEAIDVGVAMGLFRVDGGAVVETVPPPERLAGAALEVPLPFNRRVIATTDARNGTVGLASLLTGAGHDVGDLHALILDESIAGGEGLEARVAARLERHGKHLREHASGRAIGSGTDRDRALAEIVSDFRGSVLPELLRLGIATIAD